MLASGLSIMMLYFWFYRHCKQDEIKNEWGTWKSIELNWYISLCGEIPLHGTFKRYLFPILIHLPEGTSTGLCKVQKGGYKQLWMSECSLHLKSYLFNAWPVRFYLSLWMMSFSATVTRKYMLHHLHKGLFYFESKPVELFSLSHKLRYHIGLVPLTTIK